MSFLWISIPLSLLLGGVLLALVVQAAREGDFDDFEGPAARMLHDDDGCPELPERPPDPAPPRSAC